MDLHTRNATSSSWSTYIILGNFFHFLQSKGTTIVSVNSTAPMKPFLAQEQRSLEDHGYTVPPYTREEHAACIDYYDQIGFLIQGIDRDRRRRRVTTIHSTFWLLQSLVCQGALGTTCITSLVALALNSAVCVLSAS